MFEELSKIDEKYVEEAKEYKPKEYKSEEYKLKEYKPKEYKPKRRSSIMRYAVAAAAALLVTVSISVAAVNALPKHSHNISTAPGGQKQADSMSIGKITEKPVDSQNEVLPAIVEYGSLKIPNNDVEIAGINKVNSGASADILGFRESMLNDRMLKSGCSIIEGTITSAYLKTYNYEIYDDKFEKNGKFKTGETHVIYNVKVNRSWYGDFKPYETIKVECENAIGIEKAVLLNVGHTYVFPLYKSSFVITHYGDKIAGGDSRYDSDIRIIYPYHEQIEITQDGYYVVSTEWKTIVAESKTVVHTEEPGLYPLRLLNAKEFGNGMGKLIKKYLKVTD